ncbi:MAG: isoaspartyl peptidase/L-asparaginase family protein [Bacteroidia bacterium]
MIIIVHGGAGEDSKFIRKHKDEYEKELKAAVEAGYSKLLNGGTCTDAVEAAITYMEDCYLFNCGKGSALTASNDVEMDTSIMEGSKLKHGAAAIVKNVKNPIKLARKIMEEGDDVFLGSSGALEFAIEKGLELAPSAYFITEHQIEALEKAQKKDNNPKTPTKGKHGTVGAVAVDRFGNIAAGTSTGGTENSMESRIGDSPIIGVGCYANNKTCAVSTSGDGAYLIKNIIAYDVAACIEYKGYNLEQAVNFVINEKHKNSEGDIGLISINCQGEIGIAFNSERFHRAWKINDAEIEARIYK